MITKIKLHNFQCHRDLELDLGRSTVLQGGSNHGKTAVLRAFYWVLFNEAPHDFVSYWAQKQAKPSKKPTTKESSTIKFKDDEYTSVTIVVDGHVVERKRSNTFNGYIVDDTVYEALRTDVPEAVTKLFNLADASVQKQFDAPFLLAATPGEASKYLNELAGLECVDDILTLAKRKVADTTDLVNTAQETVEGLEKSVGSFSWVEKAEDLYEKAKATQPKIDELTRKLEALKRTIDDYKAIKNYPEIPEWLENGDKSAVIKGLEKELEICNNYVGTCRVLARVTPALDKLGALVFPKPPKHTEKELVALSDSITQYGSVVTRYRRCRSALNALEDLQEPKPCKWEGRLRPLVQSIRNYEEVTEILDAADTALGKIAKLKAPKPCKWSDRELSALSRSIHNYRGAIEDISDCNDYLDDAYSDLEGVACPVCGRPLTRQDICCM